MRRPLFDLAGHVARLGAVAMLATTVVGTLMPGPSLPSVLPPDLLLHGIGFGTPALLAAFGARSWRENFGYVAVIVAVSVATELIQTLVPDRDASLLDLAANAAGIAIGTTFGRLLQLGLLRLGTAPPGQS